MLSDLTSRAEMPSRWHPKSDSTASFCFSDVLQLKWRNRMCIASVQGNYASSDIKVVKVEHEI